jgi:dolichyl-phosphate-mannose--protein O-mannosyl transferase
MYFASKQYIPAESSISYSIFCFGNPVIWYGALPALVICLGRWIYIRTGHPSITDPESRLITQRGNPVYGFLFIGLLAQYLPWVLVPRGTYIYHYFASLPFLMLALSICFDRNKERNEQRKAFLIGIVFIILSAVAFIVFFPYASGISAPASWLDIGRKILRIWY